MSNPSLYRIGGAALVAGAVLQALGVMLHVPQPQDLVAYGAVAGSRWLASHWMFVVGSALATGGVLALARHLFATKGEGWAVLGLTAFLCSTTLFIAVVAPEIVAFPALLQSADPGAAQTYAAINLNLMSYMHVAIPVYWFGLGALAFAMTTDAAFPRKLAQAGVALGVAGILTNFLIEDWKLFQLVFGAGFLWLVASGVVFGRVRSAVPVH